MGYGRKRTSPKCLMEIDFRKAFDSVQWGFLQNLLGMLSFPPKFVHLIMQCVSFASYSVVVSGNLYGFFKGQSDIRQVDPLSSYLFICCMEYFFRMLKQSFGLSGFQFHPKCRFLDISDLVFADDVMLLSREIFLRCKSILSSFEFLEECRVLILITLSPLFILEG